MHERYDQVAKAIREHVAAFNAQDLPRLLLGLSENAVWQTGQDTFHGRDELATLFSGAFRTLAPRLTLRSMLIDQDRVACELQESMTVEGVMREDCIAGFYLLPMAVQTWAPAGQTPLLRVPLTHDHLSAISGIPADGRLFLQTQDHAYRSRDVVRFLRVLLRKIQGKLMVIWDGAPFHRGQPVKEFLHHGAAKRLHLEQLPGYAPDLNPDEGIWNYLKRVERANLCCPDLAALTLALRRAKERLRHKRAVIRACFTHAGYQV